MDYAEEQAMELEALEAILGESGLLQYTGMVPSGWAQEKTVYKVQVKPDVDTNDAQTTELSFDLLFQHTDTYPEDPPHLKVSNTRGLSNAEVNTLTAVMQQEAEANVGMSSIFTVMQAAKDWLENKEGVAAAVDPETQKKLEEEEAERVRLESRAHGTPVNEKTFAEWRKRFDAEMRAKKEASGEAALEAEKATKMSGREWFLAKDRPEPVELADDEEFSDESEHESDEDFVDDDDEDDDDEDFLDSYLEEKQPT